MKTTLFAFISLLIWGSCTRPAKELATVQIGMTKAEVTGIVGDPKKKNVVNNTEIWDYPDSNRTIVFREDTVYSVMTSARARVDSLGTWVDSTGKKVKKGLGKVGEKLQRAGDKISDKAKRDTTW